MGAQITYPDGTVLNSDALTTVALQDILQSILLNMIGLPANPTSSAVRFAWPTTGAPFQKSTDDVIYAKLTLKDDPYDKIRDRYNWGGQSGVEGWGSGQWGQTPPWGGTTEDETTLLEQWSYTRVWKVELILYGPNSFDNARAIRSALYQDFFTNALATAQLFPMSEFPEVTRINELLNAQWWERNDFSFEMYEFVVETITRQTVESVEVIVENSNGVIADITVSAG